MFNFVVVVVAAVSDTGARDIYKSDNSYKQTLCLMNNCPQDLLASFFLSSLTNQVFGLGCSLLTALSFWNRF